MECPKTQCTLNGSTTCGNDTYGHKHYFSLPNSEKTLAKFYNDAEMINATTGFCLANIDEIFIRHNDVSSHSGFVEDHASKKYMRMALYSKRIDSSTRISSTPLCPPLISHVCTNPLVFVYIIGVLFFTISFILGFILNRAYRQRKETLHSFSDVFSLEGTITNIAYPEHNSPPPAPPPPPSNTRTLEGFTDALAAHDMMNGY